ncbi:hypothetical protein SAMD00079811_40500 [Scytonema sp. HK-05]|uniref:ScyD/ScyE family protein n=1 Tax=Scytonema sp. HK-05 TaxID=1137095 RepID=UPI000935FA5C|nr:ScyD/ScyE family protein [Scytonema sp. HK-05]OKH61045.1 PEP-CTERM exosortase interaction domain-containing protein [Scytonema sp. HK-05]BAY46438.1 hypothetical protein SAMD00079811_40500 [Scytonema sp. HK-05]
MKFKSFALTFLSLCVATTYGTKAAQAAELKVVADQLNNPRNFDWDKQGNIYLTESGAGGDGNGGVNCIPSPSAGYIPLCSGKTGSVVKIAPDGTKTTVLSNLPSLALSPSGEQAAGPADFKFDSKGNAYVLYGLAGDPNLRDQVLGEPALGQLYKLDLKTGSLTSLADFAAYEAKYNPDGSDVINNPYSMTIKGDTAYVIDGGGNSIYSVDLNGGGIKNVTGFPTKYLDPSTLQYPTLPEGLTEEALQFNPNAQAVPTAIAVAPDGSLTVGEYTAFPYPEGKARIYSVNPDDLSIKTIADGFTQLTGVAYDSEGDLYALQHINQSEWKAIEQGGNIIGDLSSSVIKIGKDGSRETIWSGNGLEAAAGLFFGPDGDLYISNRDRLVAGERGGQLVKLALKSGADATKVPEPGSVIALLATAALGAKAMKRKRQQELLDKVETI